MTGRDFFVGDLHGMFRLLNRLIDHVGFKPGVDRLWSVGDFVDRGPDPLACIRFFRDTGGCEAVLGNHDAEFLTWWRAPESALGQEWMSHYGASWLLRYDFGELEEMADYLSSLPLSREVALRDGRIAGLVHAQQPPGVPFGADLPWDANDAFDDVGRGPVGVSLWARDIAMFAKFVMQGGRAQAWDGANVRLKRPFGATPKIDTIDRRVDLVISGHTPFWDPADPVQIGNHLFLDTLAYHSAGCLTVADPVADICWQQSTRCVNDGARQLDAVTEKPLPAPLPVDFGE